MNTRRVLFANFSGKHIVDRIRLVSRVGLSNENNFVIMFFLEKFFKKPLFSFEVFLNQNIVCKAINFCQKYRYLNIL